MILYLNMEGYEIKDKCHYKINQINNKQFNIIKVKNGIEEKDVFSINLETNESNLIYSGYQKYRKAYNETWRVKSYIGKELEKEENDFISINKTYDFIPFGTLGKTQQPNIIAIQFAVKTTSKEPLLIKVHYSNNNEDNNEHQMSLDKLNTMFQNKENEFEKKFDSVFNMNKNINNKEHKDLYTMTKEAISNILGGIGYFYGAITAKEKSVSLKDSVLDNKGLLTGTPCRSFFARGFLWDEGFHNILISKWDIKLSMQIINSWLDTMSSETGWIPREQIRGGESKSQVPQGFEIQNPFIANPPTFIFAIRNFIDYYKYYSEVENEINLQKLLININEKLKKWVEYFSSTQMNSKKKAYQWNGRDSSHNYPSGFDDLPRGMIPNDEESHLDLTLWVLELIKTMSHLNEIVDNHHDITIKSYNKLQQNINDNIRKQLLDKELGIYSDYLGPQFKKIKSNLFPRKVFPYLWRNDFQCGVNAKNPLGTQAECDPYSDVPCCSEFGWCGNSPNHCRCEKCKKSEKLENRKEYKKKENTHNPHIGYINLFPIIFGFVDPVKDKKQFDNILYYLTEPNELLSPYGIRSLSKNDLLYHTGDDYWRGNIWINLNYLVLRGLYLYYRNEPSAKSAYETIRTNIINAVYKSWDGTHTFYEHYEDTTGQGTKNRPFNGWTSMIVEIISEKYQM